MMKKILGVLILTLFIFPAFLFAESTDLSQTSVSTPEEKLPAPTPPAPAEETVSQAPATSPSPELSYSEQFRRNIERGRKEILEATKQIDPSFVEEKHTKVGVPGGDLFFSSLLAVVNVTDSVFRGAWRILIAPFPIIQKIQP